MFEACEGCGGFPDHSINDPKCVAVRAEKVRQAQKMLDAADAAERQEDFKRRLEDMTIEEADLLQRLAGS